ncbi:MAG: type VI secretion system baseplate subunit TssK [Myxococcales bacterium]|nr:type VI secretion system baseplate subunit TssK [Myxococcales bacterium]
MKKSTYQTARVHWRMGQALLPEHFYLQEEALRSEINLRLDLSPAPVWGVGSCALNGPQLKEGIVSVQELTLILESGVVIDVPGNTGSAQLNLNDTGETECFVYVQFLSGSDIPEPRVPVNRPQAAGSASGPGGGRTVKVIETEEGIERIVQRIRLSSKPTSEDGQDVASFKLARFRKLETGNAWAMVPSYVPPMVCVGPSPFFGPYVRSMGDLCGRLRKILTVQIRDKFLSHESRAAARQCLRGVFEFEAFLANVQVTEGSSRGGPELRFHPYDVFSALHRLYLHQCAFNESEPEQELAVYRHEDLATCFRNLLRALSAFTEKTFEQRHIPFQAIEGVRVCELPREAPVGKATMYWLIKKRRANVDLDLTGVKLASASRIHMVHQRALSGIPYRKLESLPFENDFSSEVDIFELVRGAEWDHVIQEGSIAFLDTDALEGTESFVWWRVD